jgi:hypothetical protein
MTGPQGQAGIRGEPVGEPEQQFDEEVPDFAGIDGNTGELGGELELDLDSALAQFAVTAWRDCSRSAERLWIWISCWR